MIFGELELSCPAIRTSRKRRSLLSAILASFARAFPGLTFQLVADSPVTNAQAVVLHRRRYVCLYGGLAFNPSAGQDAITFTLLHETGHHLARGCRLPWDPRLACECVADHWAVTQGINVLRTRGGTRITLAAAIRELNVIFAERINGRARRAITNGDGCWALQWSARRRNVLARRRPGEAGCPLADKVVSLDC